MCGPQEPSLEPNAFKTELRGRLEPSSSHLPWGQEGCGWDVAGAPEAEGRELGAARVKVQGRQPTGPPRAPRDPRGGCTPSTACLHSHSASDPPSHQDVGKPGTLCTNGQLGSVCFLPLPFTEGSTNPCHNSPEVSITRKCRFSGSKIPCNSRQSHQSRTSRPACVSAHGQRHCDIPPKVRTGQGHRQASDSTVRGGKRKKSLLTEKGRCHPDVQGVYGIRENTTWKN